MFVKICGIQDIKTAEFTCSAGADAIGFVFATSKRKISVDTARQLSEVIPPQVKKVGVFVNEDKKRVERMVKEIGLDFVQLHGDEPPEYARTLDVPVIKAFAFDEKVNVEDLLNYPAEYFLIDSPKGKYRGGNGVTFDWDLLASSQLPCKKIFLAGGLDFQNVQEAISIVHPFAVDISSGVETDGKKDINKIKQFIQCAKGSVKI
ncbi:phosphoribosylanthranilate isomerase [Oikeobacillus pervagus]|uniref:N-(5'-phosphoribosyl)anthranilate isomerase n=1 Tax=Oikeobacillus pervagus TaxID=1325931 RepID=A0AAJ1T3V4_9BACI|nr:phosphoribosylanthranilate isomerase [Oikeobacillus pervagus]MDQ0214355.1 phosphoribosylanthranilate isomerase [Oikeobacillus pervagus]